MLEPNELKKNFEKFVKQTNSLSKKKKNELRISTYNIHYFTNLHETKSTFQKVINDIKNIDADILGMQEIIVGNKVKINEWSNNGKGLVVNVSDFFEKLEKINYKKAIICNIVPSWFNSIYGNIIILKNHICNDNICSKIDENIFTFEKSKKSCIVSGQSEGSKETRCFIKIKVEYNNYTIYVYTIHLDVASENERLNQIKQIVNDASTHKKKNDVIFIMGDFNTFNKNEMNKKEKNDDPSAVNWKKNPFIKNNGKTIDYLLNNGYFDAHEKNSAKMTTWNNTRIDFIFCNKKINGDFRAEYYLTDSSDHIPIILTITKNTSFKKNNRRRGNKSASSKKNYNICTLTPNKLKIKKSKKNNMLITIK